MLVKVFMLTIDSLKSADIHLQNTEEQLLQIFLRNLASTKFNVSTGHARPKQYIPMYEKGL